ncbi:MAG: glutamine-hydrolyzing carbamoyl-phosphate synthase small subunit, partial [Oscillospiraceae bacterium]
FTTAMTGYLETLTDPSYYGQIVTQTFPLIGNYGVIPEDFESDKVALKGYIVGEWCQEPSNFRSEGTLDTFLKSKGIVGVSGIDTRALTKLIREKGTMNAKIVYSESDIPAGVEAAKKHHISDAVRNASISETVTYEPEQEQRHVVLWDFGAKRNIVRELVKRGCKVTCVPSDTTAEEIKALRPDGIMLSNGPGDPADNPGIIEELKKLCEEKLPTFGICMGHQLLALSQGASSHKLHYGHRGENQPAKDLETGRVYITSQNHGYALDSSTLPSTAKLRFVNANDDTCEGVDYLNMPAFTVQFHPEGAGGPMDTEFLFDRFIDMIGK